MTAPVSVLAVDPGCERSAWCLYREGEVLDMASAENAAVLRTIGAFWSVMPVRLAVESVESYGMPVGREVFRTVLWSGRFVQSWQKGQGAPVLVSRRAVKLALCGSARAKDSNVRQVVIDRLGEPPTKARPNRRYPHRPAKDEWSAIAIALTYEQLVREGRAGELETLP